MDNFDENLPNNLSHLLV